MQRRQVLQGLGAGSVLGGTALLTACASADRKADSGPHVVVVGAGFGGATAAKYLRLWSDYRLRVSLVEPNTSLVSCPLSNLVLGGSASMDSITRSYDSLVAHHGVRLLRDTVTALDPAGHRLRLASGASLGYDRLVLSPGVDFMWETLPGMERPEARQKVLHAWKAGPQTAALRQQLQAMPDGGVFALSIPLAPYRCPPGPYERACQVAHYFQQTKPRSKVLILDANEDVTSKGALFKKVWAERFQGMLEYRPNHVASGVDAARNTLKLEFQDDVRADVLNLIPPMRAADLALHAGLANVNQRWCAVDFLNFESSVVEHVHVLGDAIQAATAMPKSGHMANQHGKTCAAAIIALLAGDRPNPQPLYNNSCYSFVNDTEAMHVASVHQYDALKKTMLPVAGAGGTSLAASEREGRHAQAWARGIWADTLE